MTFIPRFVLTMVINIFLLTVCSIFIEYNNMTEKIQHVQNNISIAFNTAVDTAMASEEFFGEDFDNRFYSYAVTKSMYYMKGLYSDKLKTPSLSYSTLSLYRHGKWVTGNTYVMSKYFEDNNCFPEDEAEYNNYLNDFSNIAKAEGDDNERAAIYSWLYGNVGQYYTKQSLKDWSSTNQGTLKNYLEDTGLTETASIHPSPDFEVFYNRIGKQMLSKSPVKVRDGNTFKVENRVYPTLWNMGLTFDSALPAGCSADISQDPEESTVMSDNWCASYHVGKQSLAPYGTKINKRSIYMLTPMSLGVTYVPIKVAKPVFLASLENIIRLGKLNVDSTKISADNTSDKQALSSADGCISSKVFLGGTEHLNHDGNGGSYIQTVAKLKSGSQEDLDKNYDERSQTSTNFINDGMVEYDMSSCQIKVDYMKLDFSDNRNADIVNRCIGAKAGTVTGNTEAFQATDDSSIDTADKYHNANDLTPTSKDRIVARISLRMKIQIPYNSGIMQWGRHLIVDSGGANADEHYGIKALTENASGDVSVEENSSGLWYTCTIYRAISR